MPKNLRDRLARLSGKGKSAPAEKSEADEAAASPKETSTDSTATKDVNSARERLKRLLLSKGRSVANLEKTKQSAPRPARRLPHSDVPLEELVDGRWEKTPLGRVFIVEHRYPLNHHHGCAALGDLLNQPAELLPLIESNPLPGFSFKDALFIDTETTGLAGGTGTLPFLIGAGSFEDDEYVLRQFFIADPGAERGQLDHLTKLLDRTSGLVSYNGKSFDWPLIKSRYLMNGLRPDFVSADPLHLDLLNWTRRLWKLRLGSCSLGNVEQGVLGMERHDDVPGAEIPTLYFAWLRGAPVNQKLARVFYHNEQDILSLSILANQALTLVNDPLKRYEEASELYACARLEGLAHQREQLFEEALALGLVPELQKRAMTELSLDHKRQQSWQRARELWTELRRGEYDLFPYEEEAKYLEHQAGEFAAAVRLVEEAIQRCQRTRLDPTRREQELERLQHRLDRLKRRQNVV